MHKKASIITGGSISESFLAGYLRNHPSDFKIVVDGALETTHRLEIPPDIIVGDFDTVNCDILSGYDSSIILRHSPEKDRTDTELAIETAILRGYRELVLLGATGSRLDHSLANIFLLEGLLKRNIKAEIINENNRLYLKEKSFVLNRNETVGNFVSLIPLTETVEGVTLTGFKYPLISHTFFRDKSLGISNEITDSEAGVEFQKGIFIVVESKDK